MSRLRHLGRRPLELDPSEVVAGHWPLAAGGSLLNLSGGSLVQSLAHAKPPSPAIVALTTPSAGAETAARQRLEDRLLDSVGMPEGGILWASSGSDAMEIALWAVELMSAAHQGPERRIDLFVRRGGYHGNTFLTRYLSTRTRLAEHARVGVFDVHVIEDAVRIDGTLPCRYAETIGPSRAGGMLERVRNALRAHAGGGLKVLILEPRPTTGHRFDIEGLRETVRWCRQEGILVILDEIASGAYRHGAMSVRGEGPEADVHVLAKGLTSGLYPLACAVFAPEVADVIRSWGGKPLTFTYGLTEAATHCAQDCLDRYEKLDRSGFFRERADALARRLVAFPAVADAVWERTPTTLRLNCGPNAAKRIVADLEAAGYWAYAGSALFPLNSGAETRAFLHVCPPFDLPAAMCDRAFDAAIAIAEGVLAISNEEGHRNERQIT